MKGRQSARWAAQFALINVPSRGKAQGLIFILSVGNSLRLPGNGINPPMENATL